MSVEVEVEIIKEYRTCWKAGTRRKVSPEFAHALIEAGFAKQVNQPSRNKMGGSPPKEKRAYYVG